MSQINERLLQLQEQMLRKTHLQTKLREMEMQEKALTAEVQELLDAMKAEDEDVRRLEGRTLAAYFYGVIGKREEKLNQERREAYAARVKYDAAVRSLTSVREDIRALQVENRLLSDCSDEYQRLMRKKREMVKASGCAEGEEILRLEEKILGTRKEIKELRDAISAGQQALVLAREVRKELGDAESWSDWDLLGGGLLSDVAKHDALDTAQELIERLQIQLRRFKSELGDVDIREDLQANVEGFLRFADYFFDGLFVDWMVNDQISQSQSRIQETLSRLENIQSHLQWRLESANQELSQAQSTLDKLVFQAE